MESERVCIAEWEAPLLLLVECIVSRLLSAQTVVNATGPFVDAVREMDEKEAAKMITPSAGVHLVLPDYYSPKEYGLIVPRTKDGRVLFVLPWLDHTIVGTTDSKTDITMRPKPKEEEINFIIDEIKDLLTVDVRILPSNPHCVAL
jgi:glycerol-3-phosphate dehydrogenase